MVQDCCLDAHGNTLLALRPVSFTLIWSHGPFLLHYLGLFDMMQFGSIDPHLLSAMTLHSLSVFCLEKRVQQLVSKASGKLVDAFARMRNVAAPAGEGWLAAA